MDILYISRELDRLSIAVDSGFFDDAFKGAAELYKEVGCNADRNCVFYRIMSNLASLFIDIGHMNNNMYAAEKGLGILNEYKDEIAREIGFDSYFYNLSNAKSNYVIEKNPFKHNFSTIEQLIELKSDLWKAIKYSNDNNPDKVQPTYIVNLGNALKQQFRIAEALECYDLVNSLKIDIPQSWINRSETLMMLNQVSNTYSIQMLHQIKCGYENVLSSRSIPPKWIDCYKEQMLLNQDKINAICAAENIEDDPHELDKKKFEYDELSDYRKFCLDNNLSLSEHGLYCRCNGSSRDNLTIPTASGIVGDFVIPMEMVLNRLKSEFTFARHLYFEYMSNDQDYDLLHDLCFSELFNDELLGLDVEKLRCAFRSCFGILDKIGVAVCELYDLYPSTGDVYFQSFWQLDRNNRREKFNSHKSPGLLALYSIATDLNDRKDGEWSFLKKLRNDLEHEFVVVHKTDSPSNIYDSYKFIENICFIKEEHFISHLERLLKLTRSAIFSFVFAVREKAIKERKEDGLYLPNSILRKDYK